MLGRNSNKKSTYIWDYMTQLTYVDHYLKNIQCVESLTLCEGARVICIANCGTAVNGQLGTVLSTHDDHVRVDWDNGSVTDVYEYEWEVVRQEIVKSQNNMRIERKKVLSVTQLPLKLAYAITIHKSQGETFDSVTVVPDTFETGQLYTALSRCTNVHTLRLLRPLQPSDIRCDATINDFYDSIQEQ
jgi:ATP-dependent exoDNAse (exonuclease V) alpha subunit